MATKAEKRSKYNYTNEGGFYGSLGSPGKSQEPRGFKSVPSNNEDKLTGRVKPTMLASASGGAGNTLGQILSDIIQNPPLAKGEPQTGGPAGEVQGPPYLNALSMNTGVGGGHGTPIPEGDTGNIPVDPYSAGFTSPSIGPIPSIGWGGFPKAQASQGLMGEIVNALTGSKNLPGWAGSGMNPITDKPYNLTYGDVADTLTGQFAPGQGVINFPGMPNPASLANSVGGAVVQNYRQIRDASQANTGLDFIRQNENVNPVSDAYTADRAPGGVGFNSISPIIQTDTSINPAETLNFDGGGSGGITPLQKSVLARDADPKSVGARNNEYAEFGNTWGNTLANLGIPFGQELGRGAAATGAGIYNAGKNVLNTMGVDLGGTPPGDWSGVGAALRGNPETERSKFINMPAESLRYGGSAPTPSRKTSTSDFNYDPPDLSSGAVGRGQAVDSSAKTFLNIPVGTKIPVGTNLDKYTTNKTETNIGDITGVGSGTSGTPQWSAPGWVDTPSNSPGPAKGYYAKYFMGNQSSEVPLHGAYNSPTPGGNPNYSAFKSDGASSPGFYGIATPDTYEANYQGTSPDTTFENMPADYNYNNYAPAPTSYDFMPSDYNYNNYAPAPNFTPPSFDFAPTNFNFSPMPNMMPGLFKQGGLVDATKRGLDPEAYATTDTPDLLVRGTGGARLDNMTLGVAPAVDPFIPLVDPTTWLDWNVPTGGDGGGGAGSGDGGGGAGSGDGGGGAGSGDGGDGGFMDGGMVQRGNPMSRNDDVPAMLQHGEYVVPRGPMQKLAEKTGGLPQAAKKVREMILKFANDGKSSMHFKETN